MLVMLYHTASSSHCVQKAPEMGAVGGGFSPGGIHFLECVRLLGLVFWESLVGADGRERFWGHPRSVEGTDGWCRARTPEERPAFVTSDSIWSLWDIWPFFFFFVPFS